MSVLPAGYDRWRTQEPEDDSRRPASWDMAVAVRVRVQCSEDDLEDTIARIEKEIATVLADTALSGTVRLVVCEEADFIDYVEDYGRDE